MSKVHEPYEPQNPTLGLPPISEDILLRREIKELKARVKELEEKND